VAKDLADLNIRRVSSCKIRCLLTAGERCFFQRRIGRRQMLLKGSLTAFCLTTSKRNISAQVRCYSIFSGSACKMAGWAQTDGERCQRAAQGRYTVRYACRKALAGSVAAILLCSVLPSAQAFVGGFSPLAAIQCAQGKTGSCHRYSRNRILGEFSSKAQQFCVILEKKDAPCMWPPQPFALRPMFAFE
jgi:hypothetical protein